MQPTSPARSASTSRPVAASCRCPSTASSRACGSKSSCRGPTRARRSRSPIGASPRRWRPTSRPKASARPTSGSRRRSPIRRLDDALGIRIGRVAYHCDTDWNGTAPEAWRHRETLLLRRADFVVTSSSLLAERLGALHPNVHWLPDAVDAERHEPEQLAIDCEESDAVRRALQGIATPRFGCIGAVDRSLDLG
jgi:hypothetical protein